MSGGSRGRLALVALAVAVCGSASLSGQAWTPNTAIEIPPKGHFLLDGEASWYRPEEYVDASGQPQEFPGSLGFELAVVRASYSIWPRTAVGVEVPYRWAEYDDPGLDASYDAHGLPGAGLFADWAPGSGGSGLQSAFRAEVFFSRSEQDQVVNVADGSNRYSVAWQLGPTDRALASAWRYGSSVRLEYGPAIPNRDRFFEARLQIQGGPRVASIGGEGLYALAVAGYRSATSDLQEGNFFGSRTSQNGFAGAQLAWGRCAGANAQDADALRLRLGRARLPSPQQPLRLAGRPAGRRRDLISRRGRSSAGPRTRPSRCRPAERQACPSRAFHPGR